MADAAPDILPSTAQSKLLSLILRHKPDEAGLSLGPGGWVEVDALLEGLARMGSDIDRATLLALLETSDKKRFSLSADGNLIRAAQGHSVPVDLGLPVKTPPETLFHGTATRFVDVIRDEGLQPISRQHVHLSLDRDTATRVGARQGRPHVLRVSAGAMARDGHNFFKADNGVWLTAHVAPQYLTFEERT